MEKEFISLGKCSDFLMTMLGDFCSKNGMDAKSQKDYREEKSKTAYGKYNFNDDSNELGHIKNLFYKKAFIEYKSFCPISVFMMEFPTFLQKGIKYFDPRILEWFSQKQIIIYLLTNYIVYHLLKLPEKKQQQYIDILQIQVTNSFNDILKDTKVNIKSLSENATWSSLEEVLIAANSPDVYQNEKEQYYDCFSLMLHYLLQGFRKALKKCFDFTDEDIAWFDGYFFNQIEIHVENYLDNIENCCNLAKYFRINIESDEIIYSTLNVDNQFLTSMFYSEYELFIKELELSKNHMKEIFHLGFKEKCINYFINSYSKIATEKSSKYLQTLESFEDDYYTKVIIPWYKARIAIFSLTFKDSKKDKELKETACNIFRTVFDEHKYFIGNNLSEFLSDAIACDVYCNPKPIKDIIDNSQDNTNESSIIKPGKSYWEFGYALGIFSEDSKKTYLLTYNTEDNFWTNFPPSKFTNQKEALETYYKETLNSEFELTLRINQFDDSNKVDNLGNRERTDLRQPLGLRYYSNLSIRCMKAFGKKVTPSDRFDDFDFIGNYIKDENMTSDILFTSDENGATPLIRSLYKYKMLSYGFTEETLLERSKILTEANRNFQKQVEVIISEFPDGSFAEPNEKLAEYQEKITDNFIDDFLNFENRIKTNIDNQNKEILQKLKEKIILPLIRKGHERLLDEAIFLDSKKCVSALQLAIDSYDFEIVEEIINNLPLKTDLAKILISNEYVTPLQYAIRKYDYLMQYTQMTFSENRTFTPLEKRTIHNKKIVDKGVLQNDKIYSSQSNVIFNILETLPTEECGLLTPNSGEKNIVSVQQKNLIKIIKFLADKTNPISVNTFYYIADQVDPTDNCLFDDTKDLLRYLIETNHAELTGSNFEWEKSFVTSETLLAYCINYRKKIDNHDGYAQKNYGMLHLLLSEYSEKFRPIINQKVTAPGDNGIIRTDTDLHFFVTNQETTLKFALQEKNENVKNGRLDGVKFRLEKFLPLFKNAGADFDIEDQDGITTRQLLNKMNQVLHLWENGCPY